MSAALKTLLHEFAVPRMNVRHIVVSAFVGNVGSVRVFEKNGFVLRGTIDGMHEMAETKGGGRRAGQVLEWTSAA
jgi:RimJ/RimL family protein N-acetyltransferase